jgi:ElaB/YqjD/DUF883 family membrane-anchored ribosome-binding protein
MEPTSPSTRPSTSSLTGGEVSEHAHRSLEEARAGAEELASRSTDALRSGAAHARESIAHRADQAAQYVQDQPMKSLLMAAAAGAAIAMLAGAMGKHHHHHNP